MGFYLIGPLVTLIPLGSISTWAFKPYCDDGLLGISPTVNTLPVIWKRKQVPQISFAKIDAANERTASISYLNFSLGKQNDAILG